VAKKVLIVDDSQTSLLLARTVLASLGCEIIEARDGAEAVDRARVHKPDLVLMDVEMPRLDGFQACKCLRTMFGARLPILMLTTRSGIEFLRRGFESGCTGYLNKPIASDQLRLKVRTYLGE
jgi:CheY-like chemotaxis protein